MEIGAIEQTHKPALLQDPHVAQSRKRKLVNRPFSYRRVEDQRIKATPGITGWSRPSVHSDGAVRHLDVGPSHPGGEQAPKGLAVRQLKRYVSWVQNVVRQFGLLSTVSV